MSAILESFVRNGNDMNVLEDSEMALIECMIEQAPAAYRDFPCNLLVPYIAEIRRLRADNDRLVFECEKANKSADHWYHKGNSLKRQLDALALDKGK